MARTTPAQKPRGEQSTIQRGGLAGITRPRTGVGAPQALTKAGRVVERSIQRDISRKDLGRLSGPVKGKVKSSHCAGDLGRLIRGAIPVIVDDHGFAFRRWAKRKGDLP